MKNVLRNLITLALIGISASCDSGGSRNKTNRSTQNLRPFVSISKEFLNDSYISYEITGHDPDGNVIGLDLNYNDVENLFVRADNYILDVEVERNRNTLEAIATDNEGYSSQKITDITDIPTRTQAFNRINTLLSSADNHLGFIGYPDRNFIVRIINYEIPVDFQILRKNNTFSYICFVTPQESTQEQRENQQRLTEIGIDSLYLYKVPILVLEELVDDFILRDYQSIQR